MNKNAVYDNYEISACWQIGDGSDSYIETCDDADAQFWTLYGHIDGEGVEAIGDFSSREAAERVFFRITGQPFVASYEADARLRLMHAAPRLLAALNRCAMLLADYDEQEGEEGDAYREAIAVITDATTCGAEK